MAIDQATSTKALARHFCKAMNTGDTDFISRTIDEPVAPDALIRRPSPIDATGAQKLKEVFGRLHRAFPDLHITVEDLIAEGDKVVARNTVTGTHQGEHMGLPPAGKSVPSSSSASRAAESPRPGGSSTSSHSCDSPASSPEGPHYHSNRASRTYKGALHAGALRTPYPQSCRDRALLLGRARFARDRELPRLRWLRRRVPRAARYRSPPRVHQRRLPDCGSACRPGRAGRRPDAHHEWRCELSVHAGDPEALGKVIRQAREYRDQAADTTVAPAIRLRGVGLRYYDCYGAAHKGADSSF